MMHLIGGCNTGTNKGERMTNGEWIISQTDVITGETIEEGWIEVIIDIDWWNEERSEDD